MAPNVKDPVAMSNRTCPDIPDLLSVYLSNNALTVDIFTKCCAYATELRSNLKTLSKDERDWEDNFPLNIAAARVVDVVLKEETIKHLKDCINELEKRNAIYETIVDKSDTNNDKIMAKHITSTPFPFNSRDARFNPKPTINISSLSSLHLDNNLHNNNNAARMMPNSNPPNIDANKISSVNPNSHNYVAINDNQPMPATFEGSKNRVNYSTNNPINSQYQDLNDNIPNSRNINYMHMPQEHFNPQNTMFGNNLPYNNMNYHSKVNYGNQIAHQKVKMNEVYMMPKKFDGKSKLK